MADLTTDLLKMTKIDPQLLNINKKVDDAKPSKPVIQSKIESFVWGANQNKITLTRQEIYILLLLNHRLTQKNIGKIMGLSARTIECYIRRIRIKARYKDLTELIQTTGMKFSLGHFKEIDLEFFKLTDQRLSKKHRE